MIAHTPQQQLQARELFLQLATKWRDATLIESSHSNIVLDDSYQRIIGLGPGAIGLIFEDLETNGPDHWFHGLRALTWEDPVTPDHRGDLRAMTDDWLKWGRTHGYL